MAADVENPIQDPLSEVRATVRRLANPGGCAWHEVQTHDSLIPFLIEETAEFVDAVERGLPPEEVAGELGDVLYQVLFHAAIAERDGEGWDLDGVAAVLDEKLIARHPHVFGDRGYMSVEELHAEWERLKEDAAGERRGSRGALDGIPAGMPTLARAAKVVERLKRAGFLEVNASRSPESCPGATAPELIDPAAAEAQPPDVDESEIGDALLALVIRANAAGIDADRALRLATARLAERTLPAPPVVPARPRSDDRGATVQESRLPTTANRSSRTVPGSPGPTGSTGPGSGRARRARPWTPGSPRA